MPTPNSLKSRPPLARILWIMRKLNAGKKLTMASAAEQLEVSMKTIQRDMEFMRDRLELPIEYDACTFTWFTEQELVIK